MLKRNSASAPGLDVSVVIAAPPGVRISFATLEAADAVSFAADFARALRHRTSRLD